MTKLITKVAEGDSSDSQMESTFSDCAHARLRDKAPGLLDYEVGFQLVKQTDDGTRAFGIFGFEIGDQYTYAPVFFLNGEVKGLDAIYNPDHDLFVPLNEDWVNELINRQTDKLGEPDKKSDSERGTKNPNYYRLKQIPSGAGTNLGGTGIGALGKYSGVVGGAGLTHEAALDLMNNVVTQIARDMKTASAWDGVPDLPRALASVPGLTTAFINDLRSNPKLAAYVGEFYSLTDFQEPVVKTAASKTPGDDVMMVAEVDAPGAKDLSDEDKAKVINGGTAVLDKRPELKKAKVYRAEVRQQLTSVTDGGKYDVLMGDGSAAECLVFKVPTKDYVLVYEIDGGKYGFLASQYVITMRSYPPAEFREALEKACVTADRVRPGDLALFVSQAADATVPVEVNEVSSGIDSIKTLKVCESWVRPCHLESGMLQPLYGGPVDAANQQTTIWRHPSAGARLREIIVSDAGAGSLRYGLDRLAINRGKFKALVLNSRSTADRNGWQPWKTDPEKLEMHLSDFGTFDTLQKQIEKIGHPLTVWRDLNGQLTLKDFAGVTETVTKTAALHSLVLRHGCSADDAETLIKEAALRPVTWRVKYPEHLVSESGMVRKQAAHLLQVADPQDESESGPMSSYHKTQFPTHVVDKATSDDNRPYFAYNSPFAGNDDKQGDDDSDASPSKTMNAVQNAADTGQKQVFDAAVLSSLIKTHDPLTLVERFTPAIVAGMDRLGRIKFLLNWFYSDFSEEYGDKELAEFTDNLTSSFENLGELVLFMKKKTLGGDPDSFGMGLGSKMDG